MVLQKVLLAALAELLELLHELEVPRQHRHDEGLGSAGPISHPHRGRFAQISSAPTPGDAGLMMLTGGLSRRRPSYAKEGVSGVEH